MKGPKKSAGTKSNGFWGGMGTGRDKVLDVLGDRGESAGTAELSGSLSCSEGLRLG